MSGLLESWIALRDNYDESRVNVTWSQYLTPECAAVWPSGYRIAAAYSNGMFWYAFTIPRVFFAALARAYAAIDPECIGRSRSQSHIGAIPRELRMLIRGCLMQYEYTQLDNGSTVCSLRFNNVRVNLDGMPQYLAINPWGRYFDADNTDHGSRLDKTASADLGIEYNECVARRVSRCCKCFDNIYCGDHIYWAEEIERNKDRFAELCAHPPVLKSAAI